MVSAMRIVRVMIISRKHLFSQQLRRQQLLALEAVRAKVKINEWRGIDGKRI